METTIDISKKIKIDRYYCGKCSKKRFFISIRDIETNVLEKVVCLKCGDSFTVDGKITYSNMHEYTRIWGKKRIEAAKELWRSYNVKNKKS